MAHSYNDTDRDVALREANELVDRLNQKHRTASCGTV
jgi:hypothetical protein